MAKRPILTIDAPACCTPIASEPLDEHDAVELARAFAALADPVRLRLLSLVAANDEVCACDLQGPLDRSQPTVSHHTKILSEAGLITGEKRGRWVYWRAVPERLEQLRSLLDPASDPGSPSTDLRVTKDRPASAAHP